MLIGRIFTGFKVVELERLELFENAVLANGPPALLLLDLMLPDSSGVSGIHKLKQMFPLVPLAVISALPALDMEAKCLEAGADIYIDKSKGSATIDLALRALANHPSLKAEVSIS
jgi:DNA-binding response OmpR family regulator